LKITYISKKGKKIMNQNMLLKGVLALLLGGGLVYFFINQFNENSNQSGTDLATTALATQNSASSAETNSIDNSAGKAILVQDALTSAEKVAIAANDVINIMNETGAVLDQQSTIILSDMSAKVSMALAKVAEFTLANDIPNTSATLISIGDIIAQSAEYIYQKLKANPTSETVISLSNVIGFVGSAVAAMAVKEALSNPVVINFLIVYGGDIIIDVTNAVLLAATTAGGAIDLSAAEKAATAAREVATAAQATDISGATSAMDAANLISVAAASKTSPLIKSATMPANAATAAGTAKGILAGSSLACLIGS